MTVPHALFDPIPVHVGQGDGHTDAAQDGRCAIVGDPIAALPLGESDRLKSA